MARSRRRTRQGLRGFQVSTVNYESKIPEFKQILTAREIKTLEAMGNLLSEAAKDTDSFEDRSGALRESIRHSVNKIEKSVAVGCDSHKAPHAALIELGTATIEPRRFLRDAVKMSKRKLKELAAEMMRGN